MTLPRWRRFWGVHSMTCNDSHAEVDIFDIFSSTSEDTHLEVWLQYKERMRHYSSLHSSLQNPHN